MERDYETVCIIRADAGDDVVNSVVSKASSTIEAGKGRVTRLDKWGRRRLAYQIQKKNEGYYFVLNYKSAPEVSKELGRQLGLNEDVLRYQTIKGQAVTEPATPPAEAAKEAQAEGGQNG